MTDMGESASVTSKTNTTATTTTATPINIETVFPTEYDNSNCIYTYEDIDNQSYIWPIIRYSFNIVINCIRMLLGVSVKSKSGRVIGGIKELMKGLHSFLFL